MMIRQASSRLSFTWLGAREIGDCFSCEIWVDWFCAAEKILRIDDSGGDERVGERGLIAAETVAGRTGERAHAFGTELNGGRMRIRDAA